MTGVQTCALPISKNAINKIRITGKPQFLEFSTYRWREHCGPHFDNDIGYRTEDEFIEWKARDPVSLLQNHLLEQKSVFKTDIEAMEIDLTQEVNKAFAFAENSPFPQKSDLLKDLYQD